MVLLIGPILNVLQQVNDLEITPDKQLIAAAGRSILSSS